MFDVLKNKIYKNKPIQTIKQEQSLVTFQIKDLNQTIETLLKSPLLGEGTFSFEMFTDGIENLQTLVAPPYMRKHFTNEIINDHNWDKNVNCYEIYLKKPPFLPLFTQSAVNLISDLHLLSNDSAQIYTQLLLKKRSKRYQEHLINLYEHYLRGVDYPSESLTNRRRQLKLIKLADKISGITSERMPVEEIEDKICDINFHFELRLLINGKSDTSEIESLLSELDFFNELGLNEIKGKDDFLNLVDTRQFSTDADYQTICLLELMSMTGGEIVQKVIEETEVSNDSLEIKKNLPVHLLPVGDKKEREIDQDIVNELPNALVTAKAIKNPSIEIVDVELGATVQRITMKIPKDVVFTDIKGRLENIKTVLGGELSIIQGNEPNTVTFLIPCSEREIIYLKELLIDDEFIKFAEDNPLPFFCGVDMFNKPQYKCLTKAPHLLVVGGTNSGKSTFTNALLITLMLLKSPQELRFVLIDPKKIELGMYEGMAHVDNVIKDMEKAMVTLEGLVKEMERRYDSMSKLGGVKNLAAYNRQSKTKLPYIVVAIDEYNDLKMQYPLVEEYVERLGQKARASGIHMIICTQTPNKDVISNTIKTNLPSRISFKLDNNNEYKTVFGTGIPFRNLLGFGDGVVKYVGQVEEFIRFQAPVITLDEKEEDATFENIKKHFKGVVVDELDLSAEIKTVEEEPIDKLKRILATTGETRIKYLQQEMKIRINTVQDLLHQLIEEGWLQQNDRGQYELIVSEEELNKWRSH